MRTLSLAAMLLTVFSFTAQAEPIRLHPKNPHYFLFNDQPTILITSAEHYGGLMNLDFDYVKYFDALKDKGLNLTRTFSGSYREIPGSFNIERNTLAPAPGRYVCPWARSDEDGYAIGGKKFDLTKWDPAYFERLKDFVAQAGRRGVVVELTLFCPFYPNRKGDIDALYKASPMHVSNNVNGIGKCEREKVYTLENGELMAVQEALTRKIVTELNGFDNVMYEICNEPYFGGVTLEWQAHISQVIADTEKELPKRHLITQNIANKGKRIENPDPRVSVFNFHYAWPPATVAENYGLGRVIGDNETGFRGTAAEPYRVEAWAFLLAGGGLYNNLDYTFTTASPEGRDTTAKAPGSTTTEIRDQLAILRRFMTSLDFIHMRPLPADAIKVPGNLACHALALDGKIIAAYIATKSDKPEKEITPDSVSKESKSQANAAQPGSEMTLDLADGKWTVEWISPLTGEPVGAETLIHHGKRCTLRIPAFKRDIALRLTRS